MAPSASRCCTEYCPRFLLGYAVEPHQVMRSLAFTATGAEHWNDWAALCCSCGLCTLYACPEDLFPKEACDQSKAEMRRASVKWSGPATVKPHPMRDGRRVPIKTLMKNLHVAHYDRPAPRQPREVLPRRLVLPLKQSAGSANRVIVQPGDRVVAGQPLGEVPDTALGAVLHAPLGALGILESFNVATPIKAAAAKSAPVQLLEVRRAMALGGKAFVTMTGDVAAVQSAVNTGRAVIADAGMLVNAVLIPRPHPDVYREMV